MRIQYTDDFVQYAKQLVAAYYICLPETVERMLDEDVYVVWMCKTLQNMKALLSTHVPDGRYYEVTYNGDKEEIYLDVYRKEKNIVFDTKEVEEMRIL